MKLEKYIEQAESSTKYALRKLDCIDYYTYMSMAINDITIVERYHSNRMLAESLSKEHTERMAELRRQLRAGYFVNRKNLCAR